MPGTIRPAHIWVTALVMAVSTGARAQRPDYPATPLRPVIETLHGHDIADPYRWLEDGGNPEVRAWTTQQNALTRRLFDPFDDLRAAFRERLQALYATDVRTSPQVFGARLFYLKRSGSQKHAVLYVQDGGLDAEPRVVLDPAALAPDGARSLDWWYPSPDGVMVVYGMSAQGSELSTLYVRDVAAGTDLPDRIPHTRRASVAWDADGRGFLYTRYPTPGSVPLGEEHYHRHVYHHRLGTDWQTDQRIWGQGQPKEVYAEITGSGDGRYQLLRVEHGFARNDLYCRPAGGHQFRPVAEGLTGRFEAAVLGDELFILTDYEAPRYRIVAAPADIPGPEHWRVVVPEQNGVLDGLVIADGKLVVTVMQSGYSRLLVHAPDGKLLKEIELPALGHVRDVSGRPDQRELFFRFESFVYPPVVFQYDLREHTLNEVERLPVDADLAAYETEQLWCNSSDGTRVPIFVVHRRGLPRDGSHPTVLYGYGGFNLSLTPTYARDVLPWLERGGVWAVANVRGGGEFGREWHLAGRLAGKQNSIDDFIAAAEKLIADGYTSADRLGLAGAGNGGLLAAAAMVQRPELFQAAHCARPLLDMLRYHRFQIARYWLLEYGSPDEPEHFDFLYAYSPYHRVVPGTAYPAVLLTSAESEARIDPLHARKLAARLQAATTSDRPILLYVAPQGDATHETDPLARQVEHEVDLWTFFAWQLGLPASASQPASRPATQAALPE